MSVDTYHRSWHTVGLSNGMYVGVSLRNKNPVGDWPLGWYYAWLLGCLAGAEVGAVECSILPVVLQAAGPGMGNGWAGWMLYPGVRPQTHHRYQGLLLSSLLSRLCG